MNWPKSLEVIIEGDDKERKATYLRYRGEYRAAEYEDDLGRRFYIDPDYLQMCQTEKKPPHIPLQVITKNEAIQERLAWAQAELGKQRKQQDTGLILPDGFKV